MKEIFITKNGDREEGYANLKLLCDTIGISSKYYTVRRYLILFGTFTVDGITIKRIPFHRRSKHG